MVMQCIAIVPVLDLTTEQVLEHNVPAITTEQRPFNELHRPAPPAVTVFVVIGMRTYCHCAITAVT